MSKNYGRGCCSGALRLDAIAEDLMDRLQDLFIDEYDELYWECGDRVSRLAMILDDVA